MLFRHLFQSGLCKNKFSEKLQKVFTRPLEILRKNKKTYLTINSIFYGLVVLLAIYAYFNPALSEHLRMQIIQQPALKFIVTVCQNKNFIFIATFIFVVNLIFGSYIFITLPSFFFPSIGVVLGAIRAISWGLIILPLSEWLTKAMVFHSAVIFLEGQAYIIAMFGALQMGQAVLKPNKFGETNRWKAYLKSIKQNHYLYPLIAVILLLAALCETAVIIYFIQPQSFLR